KVDEIKNNKKDKVLISNLRTNILKFGTDNFYINMIKYFNNCIQILGADSDSNKIIIGYNIENDEQKAFINTITLSTKSGDIQCNKLYCQEIQANNLHNHSNLAVLNSLTSSVINNSHSHSNKSYLDSINQNLSKTSDVQFGRIWGCANSKFLDNTGLRLQNNYVFDEPEDGKDVGNKISFYHSSRSGNGYIQESAKIEVKRESDANYADTFLQIYLLRSMNRSTGADRQLKRALQLNS